MKKIKQFKRDETQNSNKLHLDKYYTSNELAKYCIEKTFKIIGENNISEIVEPSAGNGSFSHQIDNCIAYDIEPDAEDIIQQDFLKLDLEYKKGRLFIGNPPYGARNVLSVQFYKKATLMGDHIAFILPISQYKNNQQMYEFDLIHSEDLGQQIYTDRKVHCCFNIYRRPKNGKLNTKKKYNFIDFKLVEKREGKKENKLYKDNNYDFRICTWGAAAGRILKDNESYAKEVAFYIHNPAIRNRIRKAIEELNIYKEFNITSTPNILLWQLYEYILKRIPELKDNIA